MRFLPSPQLNDCILLSPSDNTAFHRSSVATSSKHQKKRFLRLVRLHFEHIRLSADLRQDGGATRFTMRLLNVATQQLEDVGQEDVKYAILSHTWLDDEVSFQDITNDPTAAKLKKGWRKISYCCQQALRANLRYVWIDTICIDKTSSAELSEAINSMFQWYKNSCICYVYLADVSDGVPVRTDSEFGRSRWFRRGWTLQELIAPNELVFYSRNWDSLGSKSTNVHELHLITGIDSQVLNGNGQLSQVSIAQRMSWAADRETTRREDAAYCLMGIFDVNMAMLYGEGEKAFIRLQEEIMKDSHDETLFAWKSPDPRVRVSGLLAASPKAFKRSANFSPTPGSLTEHYKTNRGLRLKLCLKKSESHRDVYFAALNCIEENRLRNKEDGYRPVAIFLKRITTSDLPSDVHQYVRIRVNSITRFPKSLKPGPPDRTTIYVPHSNASIIPQYGFKSYMIGLGELHLPTGYSIVLSAGYNHNLDRDHSFSDFQPGNLATEFELRDGADGLAGAVVIQTAEKRRFALLLGMDVRHEPVASRCTIFPWEGHSFGACERFFKTYREASTNLGRLAISKTRHVEVELGLAFHSVQVGFVTI